MLYSVRCHLWGAASSSEDILIRKASLEGLPPASAAVGGMRRFFDISVPRNIASDVNQLDGDAHVYNVDDLKEVVAANTASRQRAAREAEVLLAEEQRDFESWRDSLATVPTIKVRHGFKLSRSMLQVQRQFRVQGTVSMLPPTDSSKTVAQSMLCLLIYAGVLSCRRSAPRQRRSAAASWSAPCRGCRTACPRRSAARWRTAPSPSSTSCCTAAWRRCGVTAPTQRWVPTNTDAP
jgi:Shikimate / quinate 5-dehydrogenase